MVIERSKQCKANRHRIKILTSVQRWLVKMPPSYEDKFVYRYWMYPAEDCRLEQVGEPALRSRFEEKVRSTVYWLPFC